MSSHESVPINYFVTQRYLTPQVQKIVEGWRVEPGLVIERLIEHFREMGIYMVPANQQALLLKNLIHQLRNSPDIMKLVSRARQEELKRQRNRHAD